MTRSSSTNSWYTEEIDKIRQSTASKYSKARRSLPESSAWSEYKREYKKCKAAIRRSKRRSWNVFKTECDDVKQTSKLIKILQRNDNNSVSTFKKPDGTPTMPGEDPARHLLSAHFPNGKASEKTHYRHLKVPRYEVEGRFSSWINKEMVSEALQKFKNKKSPGPDQIKPIVFQHLPDNITDDITFIYKSCIALSFTPTAWKKSRIVFIPKPGKTDYTLTSSFRPIALSNYLLKGLERLCVWRVDQALLEYPIHERQHGFRCDRSTETAISEVVNEIERNIYKRKRTLAVFLDIKSAFDTIDPEQIRQSLLNHRAPITLVDWYIDYITNRHVVLDLQDASIESKIDVGFPQGGVASARFWLIAFNMAVKIINSQGCTGTAFADDCAVLFSGTHTKGMISSMQRTILNSVERWGRMCGLRFNPAKTVVIMFGRRQDRTFNKIRMGGMEIPYSSETKYLGVTLDSRLNWRAHIGGKLAAARKLMYLVNQAVRGNWGPTPWLSRWAFTGIVRPALTYACACWANSVNTKSIKNRLDAIDRLALLSIAQCAPSTPTQGLRIIYNVPPTRLIIDKLGTETLMRYRELMTLDWDGLTRTKKQQKSHLLFLWDKVGPWGIREAEINDIHMGSPVKLFRVVRDSFSGAKKFLARSQFNVYTDGIKTIEGVGSGYCIIKAGHEIYSGKNRLAEGCTAFQAEIFAIFEATRMLILNNRDEEIKICQNIL